MNGEMLHSEAMDLSLINAFSTYRASRLYSTFTVVFFCFSFVYKNA